MGLGNIDEQRTVDRLEALIQYYHDKGRAYGELIGILMDEGLPMTSPRILELNEKINRCTIAYNAMDMLYGELLELFLERNLLEGDEAELGGLLSWDDE